MALTVYTLEESEQWDRVVHSFPDYEIYYLSGYSKAFMRENKKNGTPILFLYEDEDDRAINVVLRRDVGKDDKLAGKVEEGKYFDLITPYGYGGFWGNVSDWDKLNQTYTAYCMDNNYVCEFVRFELFTEYSRHYDGEVETRTHNVVRSLEMPLDEMWMDFRQKVRKNVRKANSSHLEIIIENDDSHMEDFLRIYYSTMDRTEAKGEFYFSKQFFEDINQMKDNVMYFHAVYEGKIVSTELVIYGSQNAYSYLGGTDSEYFDVRPNDYLKYEIIRWAKEKGLKNFVLGGGYGTDDGIYQYKLCLAPHGQYDFCTGKKIFDRDAYETLCGMRNVQSHSRDLSGAGFFPEYRAAE